MYNIAVVGAGVIGLPSAITIQELLGPKVKVTIFTKEESPNTTGDIAGGLWTPFLLGNTPLEKVKKWSIGTQEYIKSLWRNGLAKEAGVSLQMVLALTCEKDFKVPEWMDMTMGHFELPPEKLEYFRTQLKKDLTAGYAYTAFVWEASKFLPYLKEKFLKNGGEIVHRAVEDLAELSGFDVVVNCTGLYSRTLVPDPRVYPVRGQIRRVFAPWQFHTVMLYPDPGPDADNQYAIVNTDCVILGGTNQKDNFSLEVDERDLKAILAGNFRCVPALETAPKIVDQVGLRPGRDEVRLELEERRLGNRVLKVVHNYGHGGSGINCSMGCAEEAAQLVKEALGLHVQSKL